jgi:hypothetical protein
MMIREGRTKEFYTCWYCLLGDLLKMLKGRDDIDCTCEKKDSRQILVYKNKEGEYEFAIGRAGKAKKSLSWLKDLN